MALSLLEGNEAIAHGAILAGCRFFAGYPITPANTVFSSMVRLLPPIGGVCLQGEDEIASMGFCLGASMAGMKAMTATSGPGISLYSEQISFAVASEIPIVIIDVQRLGPSTGSATRGADGDIQFLQWGNSGGLPVVVLAPVDVRDCVLLTMHAFNLSEEYRCPVFVASNKEVGMTKESVDLDKLEKPLTVERAAPPPGEAYLPYAVPPGGIVPYSLPIGDRNLVRHCSSTHGPDGQITTDVEEIGRTMNRLRDKLNTAVDRFSFHEIFTHADARTLVITYGVTARAAKDLFLERLRGGKPFSLLVLKTLWPVPENLIRKVAKNHDQVVVPEMNMGQYVREIERILPGMRVDGFGQMDGRLITPQQIGEVIDHA